MLALAQVILVQDTQKSQNSNIVTSFGSDLIIYFDFVVNIDFKETSRFEEETSSDI